MLTLLLNIPHHFTGSFSLISNDTFVSLPARSSIFTLKVRV